MGAQFTKHKIFTFRGVENRRSPQILRTHQRFIISDTQKVLLFPMADEKCTDSETGLEVDLMILDYFLCRAIYAVLNVRIAQRNSHKASGDCEDLLGTLEGLFSSHLSLI